MRGACFPVGRLDYNTEGLLLLTNDGDFANHILTAKNKIPKVYEVKLSRKADQGRSRNGFATDSPLTGGECNRRS